MKTYKRSETFLATPERAFKAIDDLGVTGAHMTKSSLMMMGTRLNLEFLTEQRTGLGTKYRWTGTMMGLKMDFTVEVTKWISGKEKIWETVGEARLIIYSWYRMQVKVSPQAHGSWVELSISYKKPGEWYNQILSFLLGGLYIKWCLRKMLGDAKKQLESENKSNASTVSVA